jgi:dTDP-4-amino-4,6-dideoxygalactose transaminase
MIPRKPFDIGWSDLLVGLVCCLWPGDRERMRRRLEHLWSAEGNGLACLSVRSGFDALLSELDLPRGSEVLVSAITVRDMTRIVEEHGLVPVPVDLDMRALGLDPESLARAVTPRSRAILVAHLFGSRMPLEPVLSAAREHGLLVIEDCAQAYCADPYRGHPQCDVSLFSFGPIKTATALAGGLITFRDRSLRDRVAERQAPWPVQGRGRFLTRICKYSFLKLASYRPLFSLFCQACRMAGASHDAIINDSVRGFAGPGFFERIRRRPSFPLLALLARRLKRCDRTGIEERSALARVAIGLLPAVERPGDQAPWHTHWVFPIQADEPEMLIPALWARGFDATRGASSLCVVDPPEGRPELEPSEARRAFARLLYLPVHPGLTRQDVERLARSVQEIQARG